MREGTIRFVCTRRLQSSDFASTKEDKEQNRIGQMCDESYSDALGDCQIKWLSISDSVLNEVVRMDEQRLDESCICIDDLVQSCPAQRDLGIRRQARLPSHHCLLDRPSSRVPILRY